MAVSQKLRFMVFRRDGFKCQYCGKGPPRVELEVDHVIPRSKGGEDELSNLTTSCFECNRGKGTMSTSPDIWYEPLSDYCDGDDLRMCLTVINEVICPYLGGEFGFPSNIPADVRSAVDLLSQFFQKKQKEQRG